MAKRDQLKWKWEFAWISLSEEILAQLGVVLLCTSCNDNEERFELKHCIDISVEDEFLLLCTIPLHYFWASRDVYVLMCWIAVHYNPQLLYPACVVGLQKGKSRSRPFGDERGKICTEPPCSSLSFSPSCCLLWILVQVHGIDAWSIRSKWWWWK